MEIRFIHRLTQIQCLPELLHVAVMELTVSARIGGAHALIMVGYRHGYEKSSGIWEDEDRVCICEA